MKLFLLSVILAWNPNVETNISHYLVYAGASSRNYTNCISAGKNTNCTYRTTGSNPYYFAVTAVNTHGQESLFSNEVLYHPMGGGTNEPPFVYYLTNTPQYSVDLNVWTDYTTTVYRVSNYFWRVKLNPSHYIPAVPIPRSNAPARAAKLPLPPLPQ